MDLGDLNPMSPSKDQVRKMAEQVDLSNDDVQEAHWTRYHDRRREI